MPDEAIEAIENDIGGRIFKIMEMRSYAKAWEVYRTTPMEKRPKSPMMDKVSEMEMGIARKRIEKFKETNQ